MQTAQIVVSAFTSYTLDAAEATKSWMLTVKGSLVCDLVSPEEGGP